MEEISLLLHGWGQEGQQADQGGGTAIVQVGDDGGPDPGRGREETGIQKVGPPLLMDLLMVGCGGERQELRGTKVKQGRWSLRGLRESPPCCLLPLLSLP